jgi:hypothetical protein
MSAAIVTSIGATAKRSNVLKEAAARNSRSRPSGSKPPVSSAYPSVPSESQISTSATLAEPPREDKVASLP